MRRIWKSVSIAIIYIAQESRFLLFKILGKINALNGVRTIVFSNSKIVLIRHTYASGVWALPGGGINSGETEEAAAIRETLEETGLKIAQPKVLGTYSVGKHGPNVTVFAAQCNGELSTVPNFEIVQRAWFELSNLPSEIMPAHLRRIQEYISGNQTVNKQW